MAKVTVLLKVCDHGQKMLDIVYDKSPLVVVMRVVVLVLMVTEVAESWPSPACYGRWAITARMCWILSVIKAT